jgi:hypothetical protein
MLLDELDLEELDLSGLLRRLNLLRQLLRRLLRLQLRLNHESEAARRTQRTESSGRGGIPYIWTEFIGIGWRRRRRSSGKFVEMRRYCLKRYLNLSHRFPTRKASRKPTTTRLKGTLNRSPKMDVNPLSIPNERKESLYVPLNLAEGYWWWYYGHWQLRWHLCLLYIASKSLGSLKCIGFDISSMVGG